MRVEKRRGAEEQPTLAIGPHEIRALRESARMSQAVFAPHLNLTTGYVSQLERGTRQPKGPALALLNVMRRKGVEVIFRAGWWWRGLNDRSALQVGRSLKESAFPKADRS